MRLSENQVARYRDQGFLLLPKGLPEAEVTLLREETAHLESQTSEADVMEGNGQAVRALHGCHLHNPTMARLVVLPELLEPAIQLLQSDVYVYQFKINLKKSRVGEAWPWHQDYTHWYEEDGLPSPRVLSIAIFLDEVTKENGPMKLIPGTHKERLSNTETIEASGWQSEHRADIRHSLPQEVIDAEARSRGVVTPLGQPGAALIFDSLVLHGSESNRSTQDRRMLVITYNCTDNIPTRFSDARPDYLVGRDFTALVPSHDSIA